MNVKELFKGVAVVIDDEIEKKSSSINQIVAQLENDDIPILKFNCLPNKQIITHLHTVSFVLLDWQLFEIDESVSSIGLSELKRNNDKQLLDFIEEILKSCFCPIFIFTNLSTADVVSKLEDRKIYNSSEMNVFFIKQKDSIKDTGKLFEELTNWISSNPVIYLLKQWDNAYQLAKENLFIDLQNGSSNWVNILWKTLKEDGASDFDSASELFDTLQKNITNRILVPQLETEILQSESKFQKEEIIKVIEQTKFLSKDRLNPDQANTGDLFFDSDEDLYYINIRPQCDLLRCKNPELYCLKGKELKLKFNHDNSYVNENDTQNPKKEYIYQDGEFIEQKNNCIISFVFGGKIIEFKFKNLKIMKWTTVNSKRIGKLLFPFITHIRQKYATYIEREGLPRLPDGLLDFSYEESNDNNMVELN